MLTGRRAPKMKSDWQRELCAWACGRQEDVALASFVVWYSTAMPNVNLEMIEYGGMVASLRLFLFVGLKVSLL